jgi:UPF0755 protein
VATGTEVIMTVPAGSGSNQVAQLLKDNGVIANANGFKLVLKLKGADGSLKAGTYKLNAGSSYDSIIATLEGGSNAFHMLPAGPGLTAAKLAARVESTCGVKASDFLARVDDAKAYQKDYPWLPTCYDNSLEGFLYPDTYYVPWNADADAIVRLMLDEFAQKTSGLDLSYAKSKHLSLYDVVDIAAMIRKEAGNDAERADIASVIYNRLHAKMPLQIDATLVYALGSAYDGGALSVQDTKVKSPYNTYTHTGTPPGPICSPSLVDIQAAAAPHQTKYLYYVLKPGGGGHQFCETYDQFLKAKAAYKASLGSGK